MDHDYDGSIGRAMQIASAQNTAKKVEARLDTKVKTDRDIQIETQARLRDLEERLEKIEAFLVI